MTGVLIKQEKTHRDTERKATWKWGGEICMVWLQAKDPKDCQGPPEASKGKQGSSLAPSEEHGPAGTLILDH